MKLLSVKELAEKFNISKSKIRYYEDIGLIACKRDDNNYRYFEEKEILKLSSILLYRELGFSIEDIEVMLKEPSIEKHLYKQIKLIDDEISTLKGVRNKLYHIVKEKEIRLNDSLFQATVDLSNRMKPKIDYDTISQSYDDVRFGEYQLIQRMIDYAGLDETSHILDVGCGTGNFTVIMKELSGGFVTGVDASDGMIARAMKKSDAVDFVVSPVESLPFNEDTFNFIFMTDVIHHIEDIHHMFCNLKSVMKRGGHICICTQSHRQIEKRYMSEFFPETMIADKKRYPDVYDIISSAETSGLKYLKTDITDEDEEVLLGEEFLNLIESKGYSMLRVIDQKAYEKGLKKVRSLLADGSIVRQSAGWSMVWFESN